MSTYPQLTHWTREIDVLISILQNGFLLIPHNRKVLPLLCPEVKWRKQPEPQSFGMVSFTDLCKNEAERIIETRGEFGVVMTLDWFNRIKPRKVSYIDMNGADFEILRLRCRDALREFHEPSLKLDKDARKFALQNIDAANLYGLSAWAAFLSDLQYMQPADYSFESEWRAVQTKPLSLGFRKSQDERKAAHQMQMKTWGALAGELSNCLPVTQEDVYQIWCPKNQHQNFLEALRQSHLYEIFEECCTPY